MVRTGEVDIAADVDAKDIPSVRNEASLKVSEMKPARGRAPVARIEPRSTTRRSRRSRWRSTGTSSDVLPEGSASRPGGR
jgi:hypothetical protein